MVRRKRLQGWRSGAILSARSDVPRDVNLFPLTDRAGDAALVAGMAVDDESAAVAFVRRFQARVFGLAVSITHDRALAEDIAQEAFLRAWRAASTFDPRRGSVLAWLLTITRNLGIDALRARRSVPVDAADLDLLVARTLAGELPDGTAGRVETLAARDRLRALPDEQARAVVLAVIGGLTAKEVAAREGIPLGTAKTRIRTGLLWLRQAMEAEHD